ncbi:HIV1 enhancer-binding protein 2 [Echinococcus granulosus]|uniref:HIV1 enhancer-binding protein 2 n=1 Tax=Echinococcus granulosus TaxID=6210 RepID=W6UGV1_ECHGR|nr:HIV1 enhancer-binding protein 2 [Echinococcus granulosus]EUB60760.1 HIV1 enhancer-binding protein 2 [Echinococcus granulosus]
MPKWVGILLFQIFSILVECDVGVPCAVDGSWCPWSGTVVKCSAACGDSGMGLRTRLCACPSPAHGGKSCSLPPGAKEAAMLALSHLQDAAIRKGTSGGKGDGDDDFPMPTAADIAAIADGSGKWDACNRKFCPYLKRLTDFEVNITIDDLRLQRPEDAWLWSGGIPSSQHDPVGLHCSPQLRSRTEIYDKRYRFPRARAMWTRSVGRSEYQSYDFVGTPLRANRRLQILRDRLIIRSLDEDDEGVYRYGYEYEPLQFATICFFAVYLSDKVVVIESGKPFKLTCNAKGLWPIIQQTPKDNWKTFWAYRPDAKAASLGTKPIEKLWLVDLKPPRIIEEEDIFMNTTEGTMVMTLFDTERRQFDAVAYAMSGYYQCIVQNSPKGLGERNFVTNAVQLIVVSPPTLTEKLRKWIVKHWRAIVYLLLTLMVVALFYMLLIRLRAGRVASLRNWEALEEAKKRAKLITAGEIKKPKPPQWIRPSPVATENHLPSVNNVFVEIFRLLTLPHTPPPLPPLLPPPPTSLAICLMNRETPLDLSRKAATVASGSDTIQRRVKAINGTYHHNRNHHHHYGSGKQPIPRCFECKRLFPTLWDLNIHFLGEHQSTLQREFTQNRSWKTCSLENISVHQLQTTLRRGAVERTGYPCPHCDYFAKWPTELQKHIMVHSKERPHQCVICGLTYKWKWDLGRHFDKSHHHAVNPYKKTCLSVRAARQQQQRVAKRSSGHRCGRRSMGVSQIPLPPSSVHLQPYVPPSPFPSFISPFPNPQFGQYF